MDMHELIGAIRDGRAMVTRHADKEAEQDALEFRDILDSTLTGKIIEQYPDDKPYASCLVLGWVDADTPVHSVWAYNADTRYAVLVTVYRPDPSRWLDWISRVKR